MTQPVPLSASYPSGQKEANASGVTWTAVLAGAVVTSALWLILLALGAGLGLSSVSPWSGNGLSGKAIGASAIVWLIVSEILSSSMGGYLAGRLRTKWTSIHTDEVYFRDTAHGFLAWSTALVVTAAFLGAAATTMIGSSLAKPASTTQSSDANAYFVDTLYRGDAARPDGATHELRTETGVILTRALAQGTLDSADKSYLAREVAARTGLSASDAERRVDETFTAAQQAAETARKALAHTLLWLFVALLFGAFFASLTATIGGRQRDHVVNL